MGHIHNEPGQHDYTVGAYIIRVDYPEPKVLLHRHKKMKKLFPIGGHIELTETPWQAIHREIKEESGYQADQLKILQPKIRIKELSDTVLHPLPVVVSDQDVNGSHFHTDLGYAFVAYSDPKGRKDVGESEEMGWFSRSELNKLNNEDIFQNTLRIYNFIFDECLTNWETVSIDEFKT